MLHGCGVTSEEVKLIAAMPVGLVMNSNSKDKPSRETTSTNIVSRRWQKSLLISSFPKTAETRKSTMAFHSSIMDITWRGRAHQHKSSPSLQPSQTFLPTILPSFMRLTTCRVVASLPRPLEAFTFRTGRNFSRDSTFSPLNNGKYQFF